MKSITASEKQWIFSFLAIDAAFWILVLGTCAVRPVDCLEAASFGPALFYAPFWLLSPDFGSIHGYAVTLITGPVIGMLCHGLLGFLIGRFLSKEQQCWYVSLPLALLTIVVISFISLRIAMIAGVIS